MKSKYLGLLAAVAIILAGAGCVSTAPSAQKPAAPTGAVAAPKAAPQAASAVQLLQDTSLGSYLADDQGRTLYAFAKDIGGKSACSDKCLEVWPPFYLATSNIGKGLDTGDFTTVTDANGSKQTAYYGWPLYYYAADTASGDIKGQGYNNLWFVAKPDYTVVFGNKDGLNFLVDADTSHTLYKSSKDSPDVSNCSGTCAQNWPLFYVDKIVAPSFLYSTLFGEITRSDKSKQTTFDHWPLYHFIQDTAVGDLKGQGFNGQWTTVDPLSTTAAPAAPSAVMTPPTATAPPAVTPPATPPTYTPPSGYGY